jgi:hypothetical protein
MAITPTRLGPVAVSAVATYTTPANTYTPAGTGTQGVGVVKQVIFCNTASSSGTITLGIGSSDTAANRILSATTINANETITYNTNLKLTTSEKLYFFASATTVSVTVTAYEV